MGITIIAEQITGHLKHKQIGVKALETTMLLNKYYIITVFNMVQYFKALYNKM